MLKEKLKWLRASRLGPMLNFPRRLVRALPHASAPLRHLAGWSLTSREDTNFTYQLSRSNIRHLAHAIAAATGATAGEALRYLDEAEQDEDLRKHVIDSTASGPDRSFADLRADFAKRLGWYAVARITKPGVIVETGVDKGLGSVILAAALRRNGSGHYFGTDIDPTAGRLLSGPYSAYGEVLYGDSIDSLNSLTSKIDLFINDSDHSPDYEAAEYRALAGKLSDRALVLSDNAHATDKLMDWSEQEGRLFLFWGEKPKRHWYPGGGIGFSFKPR